MLPLTTQPPPRALLVRDLIMEILSWLPLKTLIRFKCVCKSWHSVISDPNFAKLQLLRSPKDANLLLTLRPQWPVNAQGSVYYCTVSSFIDNPSSVIAAQEGRYSLKGKYCILGSCNGLVCLWGNLHDAANELEDYWFRVWNPVISCKSKKSPWLLVNLRVNQLGRSQFGFGHDKLTDTYKVVAVLCDSNAMEDSHRTKVKVYTFGDSCWRDIQEFPAFPTIVRNEGKFIDGTLNWLAIRNMSGAYEWRTVTVDQLVIVSFDLGNETYKQFLLPNVMDEVPGVPPSLEVFRGCIYLFHDYKNTHFVVWQMKEFGVDNSWTQFVRVSYQHIEVGDIWDEWGITSLFLVLVPLCISENGDILMLGNNDCRRVVMYNRRDNSIVFTRISNFKCMFDAKDYVQSLILPC